MTIELTGVFEDFFSWSNLMAVAMLPALVLMALIPMAYFLFKALWAGVSFIEDLFPRRFEETLFENDEIEQTDDQWEQRFADMLLEQKTIEHIEPDGNAVIACRYCARKNTHALYCAGCGAPL